ncbi:MAG: ACT domain-containing protein [Ruminiclostridium sp.]|nr:ACT domain-containing protein [Ruminiclostridium sp.]
MTVKQLSVFVENRPGRLCAVTEALANAGINIRAVSIADTKDFGIMRIIVNDTDKAVAALKEKDFIASAANVIAVSADDKPGSMAAIMKTLYNDNISVEYMYAAFLNPEKGIACLILRVDNNDKAVTALTEAGCKLLSEEDIAKI